MKATRVGHYRTQKTTIVFKYVVNCDAEQLQAYQDAQGGYYREFEDEKDPQNPLNGKPLFFTSQALPSDIELEITSNGRVIVKEDTEDAAAKQLEKDMEMEKEFQRLRALDKFNRLKVGRA